MEELLKMKELEETLKISRQTIYKWRKLGLPCIQLGPKSIRFKLEEVLQWIKENNK